MQLDLISVGQRMPTWVQLGYQEYADRLPRDCKLELKQIPAGKRTKNCDTIKIIREEGERMLAAIADKSHVVALDIGGQAWSTEQLAENLQCWQQNHARIALLIGGPEGLSAESKQRAVQTWQLSKLTLPHPLVRIVVAEQIYRAWTILQNHPYHRG